MQKRNNAQTSDEEGLNPYKDTAEQNTVIERFDYNEHRVQSSKWTAPFDGTQLVPDGADQIRWLNIDGLLDTGVIREICEHFSIHALVMEDILNTAQRPKLEDYDDYIYIVTRMIYYQNGALVQEQLSIILGNDYVLSFGERAGDVFQRIRDRLNENGSHIRKSGADYLAYALLDAVTDGYFEVLEAIGEQIDGVEEELISHASTESQQRMRELKRTLLFLHRSLWPLREVAAWLERNEKKRIRKSTQYYVRDLYDHIIQIIDTTETYRELLAGLMDIYLSSVSNRMNEVMKILTVISTVFMPLSFIVGLYGMNFKYMPELGWRWGYSAVWLGIILITVTMLLYFRRKKWF